MKFARRVLKYAYFVKLLILLVYQFNERVKPEEQNRFIGNAACLGKFRHGAPEIFLHSRHAMRGLRYEAGWVYKGKNFGGRILVKNEMLGVKYLPADGAAHYVYFPRQQFFLKLRVLGCIDGVPKLGFKYFAAWAAYFFKFRCAHG